MPKIDGFQLVKRLRRMFKNKKIPPEKQPTIAAVTGHVESEYIRKVFDCGFDLIYPKPLTSQQMSLVLIQHGFNISIQDSVVEVLIEHQKNQ